METASADVNEDAGQSNKPRQAAERKPRPGTLGSDENTGGFSQREASEEKAY